jgi:hypothetical protein
VVVAVVRLTAVLLERVEQEGAVMVEVLQLLERLILAAVAAADLILELHILAEQTAAQA